MAINLSARNDKTAAPVTKEAVIQYIYQLINEKLLELQKKIACDISQQDKNNIGQANKVNNDESVYPAIKSDELNSIIQLEG